MLIIVPAGAMHSQEEGFSVGLRFYLLETKGQASGTAPDDDAAHPWPRHAIRG